VGRRREFELLESVWASVERGARQIVFVGGEPGAGKSRLVTEASRHLHRAGVPVLVGSCSADLGLPFDPLVEPVRALLAAVERGELVLQGEGADDPDEARSLLRLLTEGSSRTPRPAVQAVAPEAFEAVAASLRAACKEGPLTIVLDDLHWAAESGLRALRYLVERTAELPLLILATHRSTRPDRSELLSAVAADLMRLPGVQRLDLAGLDTQEVADYLRASWSGGPDDIRRGAALLHDHTGGNPFMLREVCRELDQHGGLGSLASGAISAPESLRTVIAGRLRGLGADSSRLVCVGAVIGETFGVDLVRASADDTVTASQVFAAMDAAVRAGLVEPAPGRAGLFRFPHALARQAVLDGMDSFDLASLHARVGFALERGSGSDDATPQQLAHHFSLAAGLGLERRAMAYLEQAALTAMTRLADSDAALLFEQASEFASEPSERDRLRLCAARCHHVAGHMARAREIDERIATRGDPTHRLEAAIGFESTEWRTGSRSERAVSLLLATLEARSGNGPDAMVVSGWGALGRAYAAGGQLAEAEFNRARAVSAARASGDESLLVAVLRTAVNSAGTSVESLLQRSADAQELIEIAKRRGDVRPLAVATPVRCLAAYVLGHASALDAASADLALMMRATKTPHLRWTGLMVVIGQHLMSCEFAKAAEAMEEARRAELRFGEGPAGEGPWSLQSFMVRRETGGLAFARRVVDRIDTSDSTWRPGFVALLTELGMADRARPILHEALVRDLPRLRASASWPATLSFLGEAAAWLGDLEGLEMLFPEAEAFAGLNLLASEFLAPLGSGDRLIATIRSALNLPGVTEHFTAALEMDERMGSPLHIATTQAEWAAHLRRTHAPVAQIAEHAAPARALADRYELVRVRRILGPDAAPQGTALPDGLTARELDVLRLIGDGLTNRDIAGRLVISEYTAANHVRSILMKTQCANRTAAAHYAAQHGLLS
jgi:DNA-binding NarL/FixJ family response regulator